MNNLLSYCGLVDAKIRASDKELPLQLYSFQFHPLLSPFSLLPPFINLCICGELIFNPYFFCEIKTVKFLQGALVPASTGPPNGSGPQQGQIRSSIDMVRVYNYGPQSLQQQPPQTNPIMVLKKLLPFPLFFANLLHCILKKEFPALKSEISSLQLLFWSEFCSKSEQNSAATASTTLQQTNMIMVLKKTFAFPFFLQTYFIVYQKKSFQPWKVK